MFPILHNPLNPMLIWPAEFLTLYYKIYTTFPQPAYSLVFHTFFLSHVLFLLPYYNISLLFPIYILLLCSSIVLIYPCARPLFFYSSLLYLPFMPFFFYFILVSLHLFLSFKPAIFIFLTHLLLFHCTFLFVSCGMLFLFTSVLSFLLFTLLLFPYSLIFTMISSLSLLYFLLSLLSSSFLHLFPSFFPQTPSITTHTYHLHSIFLSHIIKTIFHSSYLHYHHLSNYLVDFLLSLFPKCF